MWWIGRHWRNFWRGLMALDRTKFARGMAFLQAAVQVSAGEETLNAYWHLLKDLDPERFEQAILAAAASHRYHTLPPVAEIRRHAENAAQGLQLTWEESFHLASRAVHTAGGTYATAETRAEALGMLPEQVRGLTSRWWTAICRSEDSGHLRSQWRQAWEAGQARDREAAALPEAVRPKMVDLKLLFVMPKGVE